MPGHELIGDHLASADDLSLLLSGELRVAGRMPWASNATYLAVVHHGGGDLPVIYKPRRGERPLWDFPSGTLARRELAAFEVSEALGWRIVPSTVLRDGPLGEGMVQRFVEHDPDHHYLTLRDRYPDRFRQVAAFDIVVNNADRKAGHCLLDPAGHVWGIDHGVAFHREPKLRTVIWDFVGETLPEEVRYSLERLEHSLQNELGSRLAEVLSPEEVAAVGDRVERLLEEGEFPEPRGHYPYPWPYV